MPRYGIVSISRNARGRQFDSFDHFYRSIGLNTGNLLFTNAIWCQIGGEKTRLHYSFDPEKANAELDGIVIPAANWINPNSDFADLASVLEKLKIPVVVIGLGAQSSDEGDNIAIKGGTRRFLQAVFERSATVSVRGEFTKSVLAKLGYERVCVTGCPSLYIAFRDDKLEKRGEFDLSRCLLHATRYSVSHAVSVREPSADRAIFRLAYSKSIDLLFQSELEELALLFDYNEPDLFNDRIKLLMRELYDVEDWEEARRFILEHGRAYIDVNDWSDGIAGYQFLYGTRLHGTIMALNSGVPATLLHHDSRTKEIADFASIPSIDAKIAEISEIGVQKAYEEADLSGYLSKRAENQEKYAAFLRENNIQLASDWDTK